MNEFAPVAVALYLVYYTFSTWMLIMLIIEIWVTVAVVFSLSVYLSRPQIMFLGEGDLAMPFMRRC